MIRCCLLTLASVALHFVKPESLFARSNIIGKNQIVFLHWFLKWSLPVWAVLDLNSVLNRWAQNKWMWKHEKDNLNWSKEVAVVTGGSAGIGACVVKKLVAHDIKVAVLDVSPLSESFTSGPFFILQ